MQQPTRPTRRGFFGAIATAALLASLLPGVASAAGPATHLAFVAQPSTTAAGATMASVTVAIQDASNATVTTDSSTVVTVAIANNPCSPSCGTLTGTLTATASSGVATFSTLSINNAGVGYTLFASGGSLSGATSSAFTIVGAANKLAFTTQPSTTQVGVSISPPVTVAVQDVNGQVVTTSSANVTVAIGANPGGGTLGGTLTVAAASGVATFSNLTMSNSGVGKTLVATSGVLTTATSAGFTIVGTPTHLAFGTQPSNTSANAPISPVVTVQILDANNQVVTNSTASVTLAIATNPGGGALSGTNPVSAVNGIATFGSLSINNPGVGYTLQATSGSLTLATSTAFNITLNQHLAFTTQPGGGGPGAIWAQQPVVAVQNSLNAVVTSDNSTIVTLAIATNPAGGTLTCTSGLSRTAVNGYATFYGCSINFASPYTYTLSATSSPTWTAATSSAFLIGSTQHLAFTTQPGGGGAGAIWLQQPVVAVQNASNAVVTTDYSTVVTLAIATNPAGGTLTCTSGLSRTVVAGVATFSGCSINLASASYYTLSATSTPVWTAATSGSFLIGSTQHLAFSTQPGGGGAGAIWLQQPVVSVQNSLNQVVTSDYSTVVTLAIASNPAGGTLYCTSGLSRTVVAGVATFSGCSINLASASYYTLSATSNPAWMAATTSGFLIGSTSVRTSVTIPSDTAVGQTQSSFSFSHATKIVAVGSWITVRFQTSPAMAGRRLGVWIAVKGSNGLWSAFSPHTSIFTDSSGVAYYQYQAGSKVWESFLVKFLGDSTYAPSSSSGTQARWLY
ncbi:MAG: hypothetical protein IVW53_04290 [Chloroflexi bacterium]|nr:hypothetical protein [Chloroflexota bacterium]